MADQDILLRLFNSEYFDEYLALSFIYRKPTGGVHEYLCNRLFDLPDEALDKYLSQFCELAVNGAQPSAALQRLLIELCGRSLLIAVKIWWLLRTMAQNTRLAGRGIEQLIVSCETAAKSVTLPSYPQPPSPISPSRQPRHTHDGTPTSPRLGAPVLSNQVSFNIPRHASAVNPGDSRQPGACQRLAGESPTARLSELRGQLGDGEGVTALLRASLEDLETGGTGVVCRSPPAETAPACFASTVAFIDQLCGCSASLLALPRAQRMRELQTQLMLLNRRLEQPDMAFQVLWPFGTKQEVVLRAVPERAMILNSRERAPFLLFVETEERGTTDHRNTASLRYIASDELSSPVQKDAPLTPASSGRVLGPDANGLTAMRSDASQESLVCASAAEVASLDARALDSVVPASEGQSSLRDEALHSGDGGGPRSCCTPAQSDAAAAAGRAEASSCVPWPSASDASATSPASDDPGSPLRRMSSADALRHMACSMHVSRLPEPAERGVRMTLPSMRSLGAEVPGSSGCSENDAQGHSPSFAMTKARSAPNAVTSPASPAVRLPSDPIPFASGRSAMIGLQTPMSEHAHELSNLPKDDDAGAALGHHACSPLKSDAGVRGNDATPSTNDTDDSSESWVNVDDRAAEDRQEGVAADDSILQQKDASGVPLGARSAVPASTVQDGSRMEHGSTHVSRGHLDAMSQEEYRLHVYGARLEDVVERMRRQSPHARLRRWGCHAVIVKSGDDCRQELLAMQLIRTFQHVFQLEGLPLWLRPYEVLPTSNRTALIELLPNCVSVHSIKRSLPANSSLADHFFRMFPAGTSACEAAQKRFAQSLAAYSIVTYLLQIKDRHNGNIMMDTDGYIIHIDFGFMLSNSPGGMHFERAPFKLTAEYMHIMESDVDGRPSPCFEYFKGLCYAGYVAAAKHRAQIIELVEMMQYSGSPCFAGGKRALESFKKRFCADPMVSQQLIAASIDAWTTRQYDYYQRALNGIL